jgi:hypothetical protein
MVVLTACQPASKPVAGVVPFAYQPVREADYETSAPGAEPALRVPDRPPLRGLRVRVMQVPKEVRLGERLEYVVELQNQTGKDIKLDPCPAYYSAFGEGSTSTSLESYLNCKDGPPAVPARGSVRFAMEIEVPSDVFMPGDAGSVYWRLPAAGSSQYWHDSSEAPSTVIPHPGS